VKRDEKGIVIVLLIAALLLPGVLLAGSALAANPQVNITVSAAVIAITNNKADWAMGVVEVNDIVYFSVDGTQNNTWSQVNNTGNVAVDIEIRGTDIEGGDYDWALNTTTGSEIYSLYANSEAAPTVYDVEVKSSGYGNLTTNLGTSTTYDWSMKFTAPTAFNASDVGTEKTATVILVASKYTP